MVGEWLKQESPEPYAAVDPSYHLTVKTLTRLAEKANEAGKLDESEQLALQGMARNITSGEPPAHLLQLYASQKRSQQATEAASIAGKLWPAHTYTQARLADYWARHTPRPRAWQRVLHHHGFPWLHPPLRRP